MTRRATTAPPEELNLIPIMNLVTLLIPFLLMSAQFVSYAVIDSTLPAICGAPCGDAPPGEPVQVTLEVRPGGYHLHASGPDLDEFGQGVDLPCLTDGCEGDLAHSWDVRGLRQALTGIKDRHPDHGSIILSPHPGVPYEALVLAMDAAREDPDQGGSAGNRCVGRCLFPDVTLAGGS